MNLRMLRVVTSLKDELPALVGDGWLAIGSDVTALLDRIPEAAGAAERQPLIDRLLELLAEFPDAHARVQSAFSGAPPPKRRTRGGRLPPPFPPEPESAPPPEPSPEPPAAIERTPHLDVGAPDPIPPGTTFEARVWADTEGFAEGETGTALRLPDGEELTLCVVLVASEHFEILGEHGGLLVIRRDTDRSDVAVFRLRAVRETEGECSISALFTFNGRPAGSVRRLLRVAEASRPTRTGATPAELPEAACFVEPGAHPPDLTVDITRIPGGGDRQFCCTVTTPWLDEYRLGVSSTWDLPQATDAIVREYMGRFTEALDSAAQRRASLVGAGRQLFRAAPENFRNAYQELLEGGHAVRNIYVVSAEPFIPWELMIPDVDGDRPALGVAHAVGRWVHAQHLSPLQRMTIEDAWVIAPRYRGAKALDFAEAEAEFVCESFAGREIRPAVFANIESELAGRGATLLHVICHGTAAEGPQSIDLDPDETLTDFMLEGMDGVRKAVREKKPFVFINACEVGRPAPALVGTGGFASAFIALGARCVVAPIWSVKDSIAARFAREFYAQVLEHPERPFADILRDLRRRSYEGDDLEDSWAAYCFYGDPLAAHGPA